MVLFVGWGWKKAEVIKQSDLVNTGLANLLHFLIRYLAPVVIAIIFIQSAFFS